MTSRDLLLALAVSYWCEGAKRKSWNRTEIVIWVNSDPMLVSLFLAGLEAAGIGRERLGLRLQIHENADEPAARSWWAYRWSSSAAALSRGTTPRPPG